MMESYFTTDQLQLIQTRREALVKTFFVRSKKSGLS